MPMSAWACFPVKKHVHADVDMAHVTKRYHYREAGLGPSLILQQGLIETRDLSAFNWPRPLGLGSRPARHPRR